MPHIRVLKPFVFSIPAPPGRNGPAIEKFYTKGDHDISDEMWSHPWISEGLAEGRIESPHQAQARAAKDLEIAKSAEEDAAKATALAEQTFARLAARSPGATATAEEIKEELNTPVNILRGQGKIKRGAA